MEVLIMTKIYISECKDLLKFWDYDKNAEAGLFPDEITIGSCKICYWICENGHSFQKKPKEIKAGRGCSYCTGRKILLGFNDLETLYPNIAKEFHPRKNGILSVNDIFPGSDKKIWWLCPHGHEFLMKPKERTYRGKGCPVCSNHQIIPGVNDFATSHPDLAKEWDTVKNGSIKANMVAPHSDKKVYWLCKHGHSYQSTIKSRTQGHGCLICSGKQVQKGYNDLASINPDLAAEWNIEKNGDLSPDMVTPHSGKYVFWKCKYGHEWKSKICDRSKGIGCPYCAHESQTSFPEQAIFFYISKLFPDTINRKKIRKKEIDVFIPSLSLGIEYDGIYYHKNKENIDQKKNEILKQAGIKLIRVKEGKENKIIDNIIYYKCTSDYKNLDWAIYQLINLINKSKVNTVNINIKKDFSAIQKNCISVKKTQSLASVFPEINKVWLIKENHGLTPEYFTPYSSKLAWLLCPTCGKMHQAKISTCTKYHTLECPSCRKETRVNKAYKTKLEKFGSLYDNNPELCKDWDYSKNTLTPCEVATHSRTSVYWKCNNCNHEWRDTIQHRSDGKTCPICSNKKHTHKHLPPAA